MWWILELRTGQSRTSGVAVLWPRLPRPWIPAEMKEGTRQRSSNQRAPWETNTTVGGLFRNLQLLPEKAGYHLAVDEDGPPSI